MGWGCTLVACAGFGCNFVPAKKADIRDGNFFTFTLSIGIAMVGILQWLMGGAYKFEPLAMIGGATWAFGNLFVPFIIKRCGLGVGQLVWCASNMLTGWATGAFGLFGVDKSAIASPGLNYFGVALACVALCLFTQMGAKAEPELEGKLVEEGDGKAAPPPPMPDDNQLPGGPGDNASSSFLVAPATAAGGSKASSKDFFLGLSAALFAGVLYGCNFDIPTVLAQQGPSHGHSDKAAEYVFSHFMGILALTSCSFLVNKAVLREKLYIGSDVALAGLVSGVLWGIAQVCWFQANAALSFVVAFPIITGVPGVIAAILGVVLFGENRDPKSLKLLACIIFVQAASLACIAVSHGSA